MRNTGRATRIGCKMAYKDRFAYALWLVAADTVAGACYRCDADYNLWNII